MKMKPCLALGGSLLAGLLLLGWLMWLSDAEGTKPKPPPEAARVSGASSSTSAKQPKFALGVKAAEFDQRHVVADVAVVSPARQQAENALRREVPGVSVSYDPRSGGPHFVQATGRMLTAPSPSQPRAVVEEFVGKHRELFGHDAALLREGRITREDVSPHNGLVTLVWQQQMSGVPVFETVLKANVSRNGELVMISDVFLPEAEASTGLAVVQREQRVANPNLTVERAVIAMAAGLGETLAEDQIKTVSAASGKEQKQTLSAPFHSDVHASLVWLPMSATELRLAWDIVSMSQRRSVMYRTLVDATDGQLLLRRSLTESISNATYRVFADPTTKKPLDSPAPMSPGLSTPGSTQGTAATRSLVTIDALNTTASPNGWINDGGNETLGNNVDLYLDLNGDNAPDGTRTTGSPSRTFDFTLDLNDTPLNSQNAIATQLFYLNNWMHDRLYGLGFTETAGNYQTSNFGRGGSGADAVKAEVQDGFNLATPSTNNANFSSPPDGIAGRMQMYIFNGPAPDRDASLDAEIVLHEYTHGVSNRLVGGGVGMTSAQSRGMGEGWSDFYALALLSDPADDPHACYASGGYVTYQLASIAGTPFDQNYYFGIRRYPYSTDLNKNPLTFKDIDTAQASAHTGVPKSALVGKVLSDTASEVHNVGEVWCVTLWDMRANLIDKLGAVAGNEMALQLVTDGMKLSVPNPTFLQARDAIIQADAVNNSGAHYTELWAAFAKRGMGVNATSPASTATSGVVENYLTPPPPDPLTPATDAVGNYAYASNLLPPPVAYTLANEGAASFNWTASKTQSWLTVSPSAGTLAPGQSVTIAITFNSGVTALALGTFADTVTVTNVTTSVSQSRSVTLKVLQDYFTEVFSFNRQPDTMGQSFLFIPDASPNSYSVQRTPVSSYPTDPMGGTTLTAADDSSTPVSLGADAVKLYGSSYSTLYISVNGYLTFTSSDSSYTPSSTAHFSKRRVSGYFIDMDSRLGGSISWRKLADRVAVTWHQVPLNSFSTYKQSFQIEMFFDGAIRITHLDIQFPPDVNYVTPRYGVVGLSNLTASPSAWVMSNFSAFPQLPLTITSASSLPPTIIGASYSQTMEASGGTTPYTWSVNAGSSLPGGLNLSSTGVLSGTPSVAGSFNFTLRVTDDLGAFVTKAITLTVAEALSITTASTLPASVVGAGYNQTLAATGGTPAYTWALASGSTLPPNLALSSGGVISGTPATSGSFAFTVQVTDSLGIVATKALTLNVLSPVVITTTSPLPPGHVGQSYSLTFAATGGSPSYTWSLDSGTLPPPLTLSAAGVLSGTPSAAATYNFTVRVTDSLSATTTLPVTHLINPAGNSAPTANANALTMSSYATASVPVLLNDTDPESNPLTVTAVSSAAHGTTSFTASSVLYTPTGGYTGTDTFTYSITDGQGGTATGTVNVGILTTAPVTTVSSSGAVTIPSSGNASPYPSTIAVNLANPAVALRGVNINGLIHTLPDEIDMWLAGPGGQVVTLMSDAGGGTDLTGVNVAFRRGAPALPDSAVITAGTYSPTDYEVETPPTAATPTTNLDDVSLAGANGTWSLYVKDDASGDSGSFPSWSLEFDLLPVGTLTVIDGAATSVGGADATLNATVLGAAAGCAVWFEYGTSAALGSATSTQSISASTAVTAFLSGLSANTTYHFRAVARTASGDISCGAIRSFTTGRIFYVNDNATTNDLWCTAAGNDLNTGASASAPKASLASLLTDQDLNGGDTVRIDTGTYTLTADITVTSADTGVAGNPVIFEGSPYGTVINRNNTSSGVVLNLGSSPYVIIRTAQSNALSGVAQSYMKLMNGFYGIKTTSSSASNCTLSRVHVDNCGIGFTIYGANCVVENCLFRAGSSGIDASPSTSTGLVVRQCSFVSQASAGIYFTTSSGASASVSRSIFYLDGTSRYALSLSSSTTLGTCDHNCFYAINGAAAAYAGSAQRTSLAEWQALSGKDSGSMSANPLFVAIASDLHLMSTAGSYKAGAWTVDASDSPCLDGNDPAASVGAEPNPNGGRANLGAYGGTEQASLTPAGRKLILTSPNGGENLSGTRTIRWKTLGLGWQAGDAVLIEYSTDSGTTWQPVAGADSLPYASSAFAWDVTGLPPGPCRVRVTAVGSPSLTDVSDASAVLHTGPVAYYVNNNATTNDAWCTAIGSDTNDGLSPSAPKATVQSVFTNYDLEPGDIVRIDTGTYVLTSDITLNSAESGAAGNPVIIEGSPYGTLLNRNTPTSNTVFLVNANHVTLRTAVSTALPGVAQSLMKLTNAYIPVSLGSTASNITVSGLHVLATSTYAIYCGSSTAPVTIENCLIRNGSYGIYSYATTANVMTVRNNTFAGSSNCIWTNSSGGGAALNLKNNLFSAAGACLVISGNAVPAASDYNNFHLTGSSTVASFNAISRPTLSSWQAASGQDTNSLSVNPLFVNTGAEDYHLSSAGGSYHGGAFTADALTSPCIDSGDPVTSVGSERRPHGDRVNLGAYGGTDQASLTPVTPTLFLVSPNGGENVAGTVVVKWRSTGEGWTAGDTVRLEYSTDDGSTWLSVPGASALAYNDTQFSWDTAAITSSSLRLRVVANLPTFVYDAGDGPAVIRNVPVVFYVNDSALTNDAWCSAAGNDANDGLSPARPKLSPRAIMLAYDLEPGDTVRIDSGTYPGPFDPSLSISLGGDDAGASGNPLVVEGSPYGTVLNGVSGNPLFDINSSYVTLRTSSTTSLSGVARSLMRLGGAYIPVSVGSSATGTVVSGLHIQGSGTYGVYASGNNPLTVEKCLFVGGTAITTSATAASVITVRGNTMINVTYGVHATASGGGAALVLTNNIISPTTTGIGLYLASGSTPPAVSDYNDFHITGTASSGYLASVTYTTLAEWRAGSGRDANSLSVDPLFVNAAGGDYHLSSTAGSYRTAGFIADATTSPCLDAGDPATPIGDEVSPHGARVEMGAFGGTAQASLSSAARRLTVLSPYGGENLTAALTVRWDTSGTDWQPGDTVALDYSQDNGSTWTPISGASALAYTAASFAWNVSMLPPGALIIRVTSNTMPVATDRSDGAGVVRTGPITFFVNDASTTNDFWCGAIGSDANDGLSAARPKATVQSVLQTYNVEPGDTIRLDTGTFTTTTDINIRASDAGSVAGALIIEGSPKGTVINRNNTVGGYAFLVDAPYVTLRTAVGTGTQTAMRITGAYYGVYALSTASNLTVSRLQFDGNSQRNLYIDSTPALVENSLIRGAAYGITLSSITSSVRTIRNCTIVNATAYGLHSYYASALNLSNTLIVADGASRYGVYFSSGSTPNLSNYNNIRATGGASVGYAGSLARATLADWRTATTADAASISADPLFVNAAAFDFHLTSGSPCVNAGTSSGIAVGTLDLDGASRIAGASADMGAYEFADAPYTVWRSTYFTVGELADNMISGDLADPDEDGLGNLLEYGLGLHPRSQGVPGLQTGTVSDGGNQYLSFSFTRGKNLTDVTITPEVGSDMSSWTSGPAQITTLSITDQGSTERVTVRDNTPISAGTPWRFFHVRVTRN